MLKTNPSQIGNLINLVYNARMLLESEEQQNEAKARLRISAYLRHLEYREDGQKRKNKHAYKQLEQLQIKDESSITFLETLHKDTDHFLKKYMPSMGESLKSAQKFQLSLLFAEKYFKFLLRIKSSEKNSEA